MCKNEDADKDTEVCKGIGAIMQKRKIKGETKKGGKNGTANQARI